MTNKDTNKFTINSDGSVTYRNVIVQKGGNREWYFAMQDGDEVRLSWSEARWAAFQKIDNLFEANEAALALLAEMSEPIMSDAAKIWEDTVAKFNAAMSVLNTSYSEASMNASRATSNYWFDNEPAALEVHNKLDAFATKMTQAAKDVQVYNARLQDLREIGADVEHRTYGSLRYKFNEAKRAVNRRPVTFQTAEIQVA